MLAHCFLVYCVAEINIFEPNLNILVLYTFFKRSLAQRSRLYNVPNLLELYSKLKDGVTVPHHVIKLACTTGFAFV